jgi:hypothetical protein
MKWYRKLPVLLFIVVFIPSIAAVVYKWVDENGMVHYSDIPPENKKQPLKTITVPSGQPTSPKSGQPGVPNTLEEQKGADQSRSNSTQPSQEAEVEDQESSQKIRACGRARQELITLQDGRAFRYNADDDRVFLEDDEVDAELNRLKAFIEAECNGSTEELALQQQEARKFSIQQGFEDRCVVARQSLAMKESWSRTPRQELDEAKHEVDLWCKYATGDKSIILRRNIIRIR